MPLQLNDIAPDFTQDSTEGPLHFYDWAGDNWVLFFSHPKDFTPVCTTELGAVAKLKPEFDKRGVKVLGLSVDPVENHAKWAADIAETQGMAPELSHDRRHRPEGLQALRHAARRQRRAPRKAAPPPTTPRCAMSSSSGRTSGSSWCWSIP